MFSNKEEGLYLISFLNYHGYTNLINKEKNYSSFTILEDGVEYHIEYTFLGNDKSILLTSNKLEDDRRLVMVLSKFIKDTPYIKYLTKTDEGIDLYTLAFSTNYKKYINDIYTTDKRQIIDIYKGYEKKR